MASEAIRTVYVNWSNENRPTFVSLMLCCGFYGWGYGWGCRGLGCLVNIVISRFLFLYLPPLPLPSRPLAHMWVASVGDDAVEYATHSVR